MDTMPKFNLKNIRNLLVDGFTESELRNDLCFYHPTFRLLHSQLGLRMGQLAIVDAIIQYAERTLECEALLDWAEEHNPAMYAQYQPYRSTASILSRGLFAGGTDVISVLFLAADPADASRLRTGEELRKIQEKLQLAKLRERFQLDQRMSVRPEDITQALLDVRPQIVHFSGHGTAMGALCFENQVGESHPIAPDTLADLFEQFSEEVKCVVLNACYSETQANAISTYIDYVIGMKQAISDQAAIAFAIGFYQTLGAGRTIEQAYKLGCAQIRLHNIPGHLTPILIRGSEEI